MKKLVLIILAICFLYSCSKDTLEPTDVYTFNDILGKWEQVSYLSSGGYFVPQIDGSYYEFKSNKTFVKYSGLILNGTETGTFEFTPEVKSIRCNFGQGWYEVIEIKLINLQLAEFRIMGNTGSTSTIRANRNNGS